MGTAIPDRAWRARARTGVAGAAALLVLLALAACPAPVDPGVATGGAPAKGGAPAVDDSGAYARWRPLLVETVATGGEPRDVYKLLYQGIMGPAHAASDPAEMRAWLRGECEQLAIEPEPPAPSPPVMEPVRPDSQLVRIHLRPLLRQIDRGVAPDRRERARDEALERLAAAFCRTAETWHGDVGEVCRLWHSAVADRALWTDPARQRAAAGLSAELAAQGWPAVHHSSAWTDRHAPHYRVVARSLVPAAWTGDSAAPAASERAPAVRSEGARPNSRGRRDG
jgi:hypothetical protein